MVILMLSPTTIPAPGIITWNPSPGSGRAIVTFVTDPGGGATALSYTFSYEDLEEDVLQSHIHLGQRGVNGGIAVFLC